MKQRPLKQLCGLLATAAIALVLIGCNGKAGQSGANGTNGTNGVNGTNGTNGTNAVITVNAAALTPDEWGNLSLKGSVTSATAGASSVVNFKVTDGFGVPVSGLGFTKFNSATDKFTSYSNLAFILAKLVPGTNGSPSKWVNYIVTTTPTVSKPTAAPSKPTTDNIGNLVDHGDGSYSYTFGRDITQTKAILDAATYTGANVEADLGDVTFQPTLTHRVGIQIGGNARGTSTNTTDGSNSGVPAQLIKDPANLVYDFVPATGAAVAATDLQRNIVDMAACNSCHTKLSWHGSARVDIQYCVLCHNDQQKYGWAEATTTATGYSGETRKTQGMAVGDMPRFIHMIHAGELLTKTGWAFSDINPFDVAFPQDLRNCTKCHTGANAKTPQGDNWMNNPSRLACGACHDNVDFTTGLNHGTATNGGQQLDDSNCHNCHSGNGVKVQHTPMVAITGGTGVNATVYQVSGYRNNLPSGAYMVNWDLNSVTLDATRHPVVKFRYLLDKNDGSGQQPVVFIPFVSTATTPEMMANFAGGPSLYVSFGLSQDGVTAPADWNARFSVGIKNVWNGTGTGIYTPAAGTTFAGPDGGSYYTITLGGAPVPAGATMITGGIGYGSSFYQTNVPGYLAAPYDGTTVPPTPAMLGFHVTVPNVTKVATGSTARRTIVSTAKCESCHATLGVFTESNFHSGGRNDATSCAFCHTVNQTSSGWAADSRYFIHAIHGAKKRTVPFTWHGAKDAITGAITGFMDIGFPGSEKVDMLRNCESCHVPGSYDFSNSANAAALPNLLWPTVGTGTYASASTSAFAFSPYVAQDVVYGSGASFSTSTFAVTAAATTTLVNSPITGACAACHDSTTALAHMKGNGGTFYQARGAVNAALQPAVMTANVEQCLICHGNGKTADIRTVHLTF